MKKAKYIASFCVALTTTSGVESKKSDPVS